MNMSRTIETMSESLTKLVTANSDLKRTVESQKQVIYNLETKVNKLSNTYSTGSHSHVTDNRNDLIIGSSVIRDIDQSKLQKTTVKCIRGGRIHDIGNVLKKSSENYQSVSIIVRENDCGNRSAAAAPVDEILTSYKETVAEARNLTSDIRIAIVLPRDVGQETSERIDALNAGLIEMCTAEGLTLINNEETFKLKDGSINDGYYLDDGTHLIMAGTNRLAKNLKVNLMPGQSKDVTKKPMPRDISRPQYQQPTWASHGRG